MIEEKIVGIGVNDKGELELITEYGEKIIEDCVPLDDPVSYLLDIGYNIHIGVLGIEPCENINYQEALSFLNSSISESLIESYSKRAENDKRKN